MLAKAKAPGENRLISETVLVTTRAKIRIAGREIAKDNIIAIDWNMKTSINPNLHAISVGKTRFSCSLIKESKVFAINYMPFEKSKEVLLCGRTTGLKTDKFEEAKLTKKEAQSIDCPLIADAFAYKECEVIQEIETGDHMIFVGKVLREENIKTGKPILHYSGDAFTTTEER